MNRHLHCMAFGVLLNSALCAQDSAAESAAPHGLIPVPDYGDPDQPSLSGAWNGQRQTWADKGLQVDAIWTQVGQGVVDGGQDTGWRYGGKLETDWRIDLDRMQVLPGALITMRTESRYGRSVNGIAGTLLPVNDALFFPLTDELDEDIPLTITELRYTQFLSKKFGVFLGKFVVLGGDANEFAGGRGDTQFMGHTFLSASVTALMNPYSTLGGGVVLMPSPNVVVTSSVYASTDSSTSAGFDTLDDGLIWSTSVRNRYELAGKPGGMMLTGQLGFDNQFLDFNGSFLGDAGLVLPQEGDTWSAFWNGWQYLSVLDDSTKPVDVTNGRTDRRGYGVFARAAIADRETNPVPWVVSGGFGGRGIFDSRTEDSFGVGYGYSKVREEPFITGNILESRSQRFEAYYTFALQPGVELSFNGQFADSILEGNPSATILGARLRLQF